MIIENEALTEPRFIEKSIKVEKLENGNFQVTARAIPTKKKEQEITMEFTSNGFSALLGSWMAMEKTAKESGANE